MLYSKKGTRWKSRGHACPGDSKLLKAILLEKKALSLENGFKSYGMLEEGRIRGDKVTKKMFKLKVIVHVLALLVNDSEHIIARIFF